MKFEALEKQVREGITAAAMATKESSANCNNSSASQTSVNKSSNYAILDGQVNKFKETTNVELVKLRGDIDSIHKNIKSLQCKLGSQTFK